MPPKTIEDDLRPISLTPQIAKVMEGFTLEPLLADIGDQIDPYQFATKGRSTTQALVFLLYIMFWRPLTEVVPRLVYFSLTLVKVSI